MKLSDFGLCKPLDCTNLQEKDFTAAKSLSGALQSDGRPVVPRRTQQEQLQHWQRNRRMLVFLLKKGYGMEWYWFIVNWRTHLKFPEEVKLSPEAKDLICKLLCNVEKRLGTKGAYEIKVHPWFKGIEWEKLYQMEVVFIPKVNGELDTQNFEKFEEVTS
ncbi:putative non-specific serine/threonine protein kinase [Helianthus annuus]|nr:putative non-specific serine/threonine protein kinase [Helianthus annuus]